MASTSANELNRVLWWAANSGDNEQVKSLIASGAQPVFKHVGYSGSTALHRAAAGGFDDVLSTLLDNGADVNALTKTNWTALHSAAFAGKCGSIRLLLQFGADPNQLNSASQTALELALAYKQFAAADELRQEKQGDELAVQRSSSKKRPSVTFSIPASNPFAHLKLEEAHAALAKLSVDSAAEIASLKDQLEQANKKAELFSEQQDEVLSEKLKEIRTLKIQLEEMTSELEDALSRIEELEQSSR